MSWSHHPVHVDQRRAVLRMARERNCLNWKQFGHFLRRRIQGRKLVVDQARNSKPHSNCSRDVLHMARGQQRAADPDGRRTPGRNIVVSMTSESRHLGQSVLVWAISRAGTPRAIRVQREFVRVQP